MTAVFDQGGIRFRYPQNWQLNQSAGVDDVSEINVEAPSGAFWTLHTFPIGTDKDQLLKNVVASLDEQYESLEVVAVQGEIAGQAYQGFEAYFYCLDFLVTTQIRVVTIPPKVLLIICQAENREFDKQELVFRAISTSLLTELTASQTDS